MAYLWTIFIMVSFDYLMLIFALSNKQVRILASTAFIKKYPAKWDRFTQLVKIGVHFFSYCILAGMLLFDCFVEYIPYLIGFTVFNYISALVYQDNPKYDIIYVLGILWGTYSFFSYLGYC